MLRRKTHQQMRERCEDKRLPGVDNNTKGCNNGRAVQQWMCGAAMDVRPIVMPISSTSEKQQQYRTSSRSGGLICFGPPGILSVERSATYAASARFNCLRPVFGIPFVAEGAGRRLEGPLLHPS